MAARTLADCSGVGRRDPGLTGQKGPEAKAQPGLKGQKGPEAMAHLRSWVLRDPRVTAVPEARAFS